MFAIQGRRRPHQPPRRPLYTRADVARTVERFVEHDYHAPWRLHPGIDVTFFDAGHILGSALTVFEISSGGRRFRLGMSGDLGRLVASVSGLEKLIAFLEANPYTVNTARQIALRVGREADSVQQELELLEQRRFVQKISYPGADVYRYIPPRRR